MIYISFITNTVTTLETDIGLKILCAVLAPSIHLASKLVDY